MKKNLECFSAALSILLISFLFATCSKKGLGPTMIISYFPTAAGGGDTVIVHGRNLPSNNTMYSVSLNGHPVNIVSSTPDSIIAIVPKMAGSGPVIVSVGKTTYTGPLFTYNYVTSVTTIAGSGQVGMADGKGSNASFNCPWGITADANGDLYIADTYNRLIRKWSVSTNEISTIAIPTYINGTEIFYSPYNIALDRVTHNLYVTDFNLHLLKINRGGSMKVIYDDTMPTTGIALGPDGFLYMSNNSLGTVTKLDTNGNNLSRFGTALVTPRNIIFDKAGNMYVSGYGIYKITPTGTKTILTRDYQFSGWEIAMDAWGNIYEADHFNNYFRMIEASTGNMLTLAGSGTAADIDGVGLNASFNGPQGLTIDDNGNFFLTTYNYDTGGGNNLRKITVQ